MFKENEDVLYLDSSNGNDNWVNAKILKIHYDDVEPYFTIKIGNKEKQTIGKKLKKDKKIIKLFLKEKY